MPHVTGHERSQPIKQPGKQTLNLNVNESALETSEASWLLREQLHSSLNLWLPFPLPPPSLPHHPLKFKEKGGKKKEKGRKKGKWGETTLILTLRHASTLGYVLSDPPVSRT